MVTLKLTGEIWYLDDIIQSIKEAQEDVVLEINSPGGSVFAGLELIRAIQNSPHTITARVSVVAASIAAVIALACDKVEISETDIFMLHNCSLSTYGTKEDVQQDVELMKTADAVIHGIVRRHCKDAEDIEARMDKGDVWLTGEQVADLFDHAVLIETKKDATALAAVGGLSSLVAMVQKLSHGDAADPHADVVDENPQGDAALVDPVPKEGKNPDDVTDESPDDTPKDVSVSPALVALLAIASKEG